MFARAILGATQGSLPIVKQCYEEYKNTSSKKKTNFFHRKFRLSKEVSNPWGLELILDHNERDEAYAIYDEWTTLTAEFTAKRRETDMMKEQYRLERRSFDELAKRYQSPLNHIQKTISQRDYMQARDSMLALQKQVQSLQVALAKCRKKIEAQRPRAAWVEQMGLSLLHVIRENVKPCDTLMHVAVRSAKVLGPAPAWEPETEDTGSATKTPRLERKYSQTTLTARKHSLDTRGSVGSSAGQSVGSSTQSVVGLPVQPWDNAFFHQYMQRNDRLYAEKLQVGRNGDTKSLGGAGGGSEVSSIVLQPPSARAPSVFRTDSEHQGRDAVAAQASPTSQASHLTVSSMSQSVLSPEYDTRMRSGRRMVGVGYETTVMSPSIRDNPAHTTADASDTVDDGGNAVDNGGDGAVQGDQVTQLHGHPSSTQARSTQASSPPPAVPPRPSRGALQTVTLHSETAEPPVPDSVMMQASPSSDPPELPQRPRRPRPPPGRPPAPLRPSPAAASPAPCPPLPLAQSTPSPVAQSAHVQSAQVLCGAVAGCADHCAECESGDDCTGGWAAHHSDSDCSLSRGGRTRLALTETRDNHSPYSHSSTPLSQLSHQRTMYPMVPASCSSDDETLNVSPSCAEIPPPAPPLPGAVTPTGVVETQLVAVRPQNRRPLPPAHSPPTKPKIVSTAVVKMPAVHTAMTPPGTPSISKKNEICEQTCPYLGLIRFLLGKGAVRVQLNDDGESPFQLARLHPDRQISSAVTAMFLEFGDHYELNLGPEELQYKNRMAKKLKIIACLPTLVYLVCCAVLFGLLLHGGVASSLSGLNAACFFISAIAGFSYLAWVMNEPLKLDAHPEYFTWLPGRSRGALGLEAILVCNVMVVVLVNTWQYRNRRNDEDFARQNSQPSPDGVDTQQISAQFVLGLIFLAFTCLKWVWLSGHDRRLRERATTHKVSVHLWRGMAENWMVTITVFVEFFEMFSNIYLTHRYRGDNEAIPHVFFSITIINLVGFLIFLQHTLVSEAALIMHVAVIDVFTDLPSLVTNIVSKTYEDDVFAAMLAVCSVLALVKSVVFNTIVQCRKDSQPEVEVNPQERLPGSEPARLMGPDQAHENSGDREPAEGDVAIDMPQESPTAQKRTGIFSKVRSFFRGPSRSSRVVDSSILSPSQRAERAEDGDVTNKQSHRSGGSPISPHHTQHQHQHQQQADKGMEPDSSPDRDAKVSLPDVDDDSILDDLRATPQVGEYFVSPSTMQSYPVSAHSFYFSAPMNHNGTEPASHGGDGRVRDGSQGALPPYLPPPHLYYYYWNMYARQHHMQHPQHQPPPSHPSEPGPHSSSGPWPYPMPHPFPGYPSFHRTDNSTGDERDTATDAARPSAGAETSEANPAGEQGVAVTGEGAADSDATAQLNSPAPENPDAHSDIATVACMLPSAAAEDHQAPRRGHFKRSSTVPVLNAADLKSQPSEQE